MEHPPIESVPLVEVICALANPVRLEIVRQMAEAGGVYTGEFDVPVNSSTLSHHLRVLRLAGLLRVTARGSFRAHELRRDEVEAHYPGVLSSVLKNLTPLDSPP